MKTDRKQTVTEPEKKHRHRETNTETDRDTGRKTGRETETKRNRKRSLFDAETGTERHRQKHM